MNKKYVKLLEMAPTPEERAELEKRIEECERRKKEIFERPETKRKGRLLKNWMAHGHVGDIAGSLFCPKCGKDYHNLKWACCNLDIVKAIVKASDVFQRDILGNSPKLKCYENCEKWDNCPHQNPRTWRTSNPDNCPDFEKKKG